KSARVRPEPKLFPKMATKDPGATAWPAAKLAAFSTPEMVGGPEEAAVHDPGEDCAMCRRTWSAPTANTSRRPSESCATDTVPFSVPPRLAEFDQAPPGDVCDTWTSVPSAPVPNTSRRPSAFVPAATLPDTVMASGVQSVQEYPAAAVCDEV